MIIDKTRDTVLIMRSWVGWSGNVTDVESNNIFTDGVVEVLQLADGEYMVAITGATEVFATCCEELLQIISIGEDVTSASFRNCEFLVSVKDVVLPPRMKDANCMFANCTSLRMVDGFNCNQVINARGMFKNTSVSNLSKFIFKGMRLEDCSYMFSECKIATLQNIVFSDTIRDMSYMFSHNPIPDITCFMIPKSCTNVEGLFQCTDISKVSHIYILNEGLINCDLMFYGCLHLTDFDYINLPDSVQTARGMFAYTHNNLTLTDVKLNDNLDIHGMFLGSDVNFHKSNITLPNQDITCNVVGLNKTCSHVVPTGIIKHCCGCNVCSNCKFKCTYFNNKGE